MSNTMESDTSERKYSEQSSSQECVTSKLQDMDVNSDEENENDSPQAEEIKSLADENNAMQKLNAYVEEKQLDENKMKKALAALRDQELANKEAERKREKELAGVKISKDDVQLIVVEMDVSVSVADRKLREADGNIEECLKSFLE